MMHKYNKKKFVSKTAIQVARMIAQNDDESILLALHRFEGSKTATLMRLHLVDYYYGGPGFSTICGKMSKSMGFLLRQKNWSLLMWAKS